jgi:hypothetical protein
MNSYVKQNKNEQSVKATVFTDPFGNSQLKYDIVLNDTQTDECKIHTQKYQDEALRMQQPKKQSAHNRPIPRITTNNIQFLTRFSLITCIFFPITGIPAIILSQLMKKEFYNCNYEKAIEYKVYAKILAYLTVLFGIIALTIFMVCIPVFL